MGVRVHDVGKRVSGRGLGVNEVVWIRQLGSGRGGMGLYCGGMAVGRRSKRASHASRAARFSAS